MNGRQIKRRLVGQRVAAKRIVPTIQFIRLASEIAVGKDVVGATARPGTLGKTVEVNRLRRVVVTRGMGDNGGVGLAVIHGLFVKRPNAPFGKAVACKQVAAHVDSIQANASVRVIKKVTVDIGWKFVQVPFAGGIAGFGNAHTVAVAVAVQPHNEAVGRFIVQGIGVKDAVKKAINNTFSTQWGEKSLKLDGTNQGVATFVVNFKGYVNGRNEVVGAGRQFGVGRGAGTTPTALIDINGGEPKPNGGRFGNGVGLLHLLARR